MAALKEDGGRQPPGGGAREPDVCDLAVCLNNITGNHRVVWALLTILPPPSSLIVMECRAEVYLCASVKKVVHPSLWFLALIPPLFSFIIYGGKTVPGALFWKLVKLSIIDK